MPELLGEDPVRAGQPAPPPAARGPSRVAVIQDHAVLVAGLASILQDEDDLALMASAATVPRLLDLGKTFDLVLLDLLLADGSTPRENVTRLLATGARVVAYTSDGHPALTREAVEAGLCGMIGKSEPPEVLVRDIRAALRGEIVGSADWAAAIDGRPDGGARPRLSAREEQVLTLYASGEKADRVARALGVSRETVLDHIKSIRAKYAADHRPAPTKVHLYRRAVEDGLLPPVR